MKIYKTEIDKLTGRPILYERIADDFDQEIKYTNKITSWDVEIYSTRKVEYIDTGFTNFENARAAAFKHLCYELKAEIRLGKEYVNLLKKLFEKNTAESKYYEAIVKAYLSMEVRSFSIMRNNAILVEMIQQGVCSHCSYHTTCEQYTNPMLGEGLVFCPYIRNTIYSMKLREDAAKKIIQRDREYSRHIHIGKHITIRF